jgi:transcriptional regulator with XRE-family HTH domain
MATRERPVDIGRRRGRELTAAASGECRSARLAAGLSQAVVARAAAMSPSQYGRIERLECRSVGVDRSARIASVLGLELALRVYPVASPIRDVGHLRLTARFRALLHPTIAWKAEVPLPIRGDRRAWDGTISAHGAWIAVEIETRLRDAQALQRRIALKTRDSGGVAVILVLADTPVNRRALAVAEDSLRSQFPLTSRQVRGALRAGDLPQGGGIVLC